MSERLGRAGDEYAASGQRKLGRRCHALSAAGKGGLTTFFSGCKDGAPKIPLRVWPEHGLLPALAGNGERPNATGEEHLQCDSSSARPHGHPPQPSTLCLLGDGLSIT